MSLTRAAVYVTGGALLIAYLAAANSSPSQEYMLTRERASRPLPAPDALAREVEAESSRLRERLAMAPAPDLNSRNPFTFAPAVQERQRVRVEQASAPRPDVAAPAPVPPPQLSLMGIAEEASPAGPRRTAIIGGSGDALYIVTEGQTVADRYKVTAIGADAIELLDLQTGGYRRLAMR